MIQLANVAKGFGKNNFSALKDINLTIEKRRNDSYYGTFWFWEIYSP